MDRKGADIHCWPGPKAPSIGPSPALLVAGRTSPTVRVGPDTIEILFDRQIRGGQRATGGEFKTKIVTRGTEVTVNAFYKRSRIKQYLKDGRVLQLRYDPTTVFLPDGRKPHGDTN